jgi:hypothetical protein
MRSTEQKRYIETLKRYEKKMDRNEREMYAMFVKRHKDDEDLDNISFGKLKDLFVKFHANREKKNFDHIFKKPDSD